MTTTTSFGRVRSLTRHEARRAVRGIVPRVVFLAIPIALAAFLLDASRLALLLGGRPGANGSEQAIPGMACLISFMTLIFMGYSLFGDHDSGMLSRLRAARVRPLELIASKCSVMFAHLVAQFVILFAVGFVIFGLHVDGSVGGVAVAVLASSAMLVAYAFMAFAISSSNALYNVFCYLGALALTSVGGGLFPVAMLPSWTRRIAPASPVYWMMSAFQRAIFGGSLADLGRPLGVLAAFAVGFAVVATVVYDPERSKEAFHL